MEKLSHSTTLETSVPAWRVGLEDRIDPLSLRLVDECLSYGYQSAAEWKMNAALSEAQAAVAVEEVAR